MSLNRCRRGWQMGLIILLGGAFNAVVLHAAAADHAAVVPAATTRVTGWIVDYNTGKPLAGIAVTAVPGYNHMANRPGEILPLPGMPVYDGMPTAKTDANGQYVLEFQIPSRHRQIVAVKAIADWPGVSGSSLLIYPGETVSAPPLAAIAKLAPIRGRVLGADGQPLAGAMVFAQPRAYDEEGTITDSTGAFTVPAGGPFGLYVTIAAPGYELAENLHCAGDDPHPEFRLKRRCASISGVVTDRDGKPAPGVRIYAAQSLNHSTRWYVTSGPDGRFTMATMPNRNKRNCVLWPARGQVQAGAAVNSAPGRNDVTLKLLPTGTIEVVLLDAEGKPLPAGTIEVGVRHTEGKPLADAPVAGLDAAPGQPQLWINIRGKTDRNGRVTLENVPALTYSLHAILPQNREETESPPDLVVATVVAGKTCRIKLQCRKFVPPQQPVGRPTVQGILVDATSQPLRHATVNACLMRSDASNQPIQYFNRTLTDADGRFAITLVLRPGGQPGPAVRRSNALPFSDSLPLAPSQLDQIRIAVTIDGNVNHATFPRPITERRFPAQRRTAALDPDYALGPDLVFDLTRDWPTGQDQLDLGRLNTDLPPERIVSLAAWPVPPERDQQPRRNSWVKSCLTADGKPVICRMLAPRSPDEQGFPVAIRTTQDCRIVLENRLGDSAEVTVPAGSAGPIAVPFPPARKIELVVQNATGEAVPGMRFFAVNTSNEGPSLQKTFSDVCLDSDKNGKISFAVSSLAAGKYHLIGFNNGNLRYEPYLGEITAGEAPVIQTIRLQDAIGILFGMVLDAQKQPVPETDVVLAIELASVMTFVQLDVDEAGAFQTPLPSGAKVKVTARAETVNGYLLGESEWIEFKGRKRQDLRREIIISLIPAGIFQQREQAELIRIRETAMERIRQEQSSSPEQPPPPKPDNAIDELF